MRRRRVESAGYDSTKVATDACGRVIRVKVVAVPHHLHFEAQR